MKRVCLVPRLSGVGGMVSFQARLSQGLIQRGIQVCYDLADEPYEAVLVIGGTRNLGSLRRIKQRGVRIVQRLDGMNWIHRRRWTGIRHFLRAEYGNLVLTIIRRALAGHIVYQSEFSKSWWEREHGVTRTAWSVVYNGVDLDEFSPSGEEVPPVGRSRMLLVEGTLGGGYEIGLETAVQLAERLNYSHSQEVEVVVAGKVRAEIRMDWSKRTKVALTFEGQVPGEAIPALDRSANFLYAADINAACPNAVIEALACGLPVVAFDTGALPELVRGDAGRLVSYGGDPWKLEPPDVDGLARASLEVLNDQMRFRTGARQRAEDGLGLDKMVDGYLEALEE
jgi:glycosyltransferase involved in cell wall biosynthesis